MNKIKTELLNCYGIKKLNYEFDFTTNNACIVYAPNGTMKTSFTKTMRDFKYGIESQDRIYVDRQYKRAFFNDSEELKPDEVIVFESLDEKFESDKITNLIVDAELKRKYDKINNTIDKSKKELLKLLEKQSGISIRSGLENKITVDYSNRNLLECLIKANELEVNEEISKIKYKDIINDKVEKFLQDRQVIQLLEEYIERYNELLSKSTFFKKGIFNHNNAADIAANLKKNKYFNANYKLLVNDEIIINTEKELLELISKEKDKILTDNELIQKFDEIDSHISRNEDLKKFRTILENNKWLVAEVVNYHDLKVKLWSAYIKFNKVIQENFNNLIQLYKNSKDELSKIINEANKQSSAWKKVVDIYNSRFDVPFIVTIENQEDVMLKEEKPSLVFKYRENEEESEIKRDELLQVLSKGEQRALYILNIIFEIEGLKKDNSDRLIVLDDIADSFDYKNKYAIIEYLKDIKEENIFKMIVFTHNFDFYRTVSSRIEMDNLMTIKNENEINIVDGQYTKDVFKYWKKSIATNKRIFISAIPFVRNICDYTDKTDASKKLTAALHIKPNTFDIKVNDLVEVFNSVWTKNISVKFNDRITDLIFNEANSIVLESNESINLQNKIVLSIGIRLFAELYMIELINNPEFVNGITKNQTKRLFDKFKEEFKEMEEEIKILSQVNIMTAENIHVNAFMYEPLLDISDNHLKKLYNKVKYLYENINNREIAATHVD